MADNLMVEKLKAALKQQSKQPTRKRWDDLVSRGAIDASGRVLIRGPQGSPPPTAQKGGKPKAGK